MPAFGPARNVATLVADSLERKTSDVAVQQLMARVSVAHDPRQEAVPRKESARVTVRAAMAAS